MDTPLLSNPMICEAGRIFRVLGDPSRLRLLQALLASGGPVNLRGLAESTGLSQANASKHLACLVETGLVLREKEGQQVLFLVSGPMVRELCGLVKVHVLDRSRSAYASLR